MRALLLDIGNSRVKWGVCDGRDAGRIRQAGELAITTLAKEGAAALAGRLPADVDTAMAANVAGARLGDEVHRAVAEQCGCKLGFARTEKTRLGVTNSYETPSRMGVDRWVAMIAAFAEIRAACLVVDAGTAVTLDALDDGGRHLGGQILPGLELMARSLSGGTSDIPEVGRARRPGAAGYGIFGSTTAAAVHLGAIGAVTGAIERALRVLREHDLAPELVLTGGDASRILDALHEPALHRPHLVLTGLARLIETPSIDSRR